MNIFNNLVFIVKLKSGVGSLLLIAIVFPKKVITGWSYRKYSRLIKKKL